MNKHDLMQHFGMFLFPWGTEPPTIDSLVRMAQLAEELGFESIQIPWHYTMPTERIFPAFNNRYCLDPTIVLPIVARETTEVRIGLNSAVLPTVHPYHWAKWFSTMDVITGGRFFGGVAVGWWKEDFQASGTELAGRGARFDEGLAILDALLAGRPITEPGTHYDATGLALEPLPIQQPFPVWLGGNKKSIERASRYAEALCTINPSAEQLRSHLRPALDEADARNGGHTQMAAFNYVLVEEDERKLREYYWPRMASRINYISLEEAMNAKPGDVAIDPDERVIWGSAEECARRLRELLDAGIDKFVLDFHYHGLEDEAMGQEQMRRFVEEVVPKL